MDDAISRIADADLRFRVESFLKSRHFPNFENLEVHVSGNVVTLSGWLQSYYEKQVAVSSCQRVAGVLCLNDNIKIGLDESYRLDGKKRNKKTKRTKSALTP